MSKILLLKKKKKNMKQSSGQEAKETSARHITETNLQRWGRGGYRGAVGGYASVWLMLAGHDVSVHG